MPGTTIILRVRRGKYAAGDLLDFPSCVGVTLSSDGVLYLWFSGCSFVNGISLV